MRFAILLLALSRAITFAADNVVVAPLAAKSPQSIVQCPTSILSGTEAITIPQMLSYQGRLTDTLGVPVADTLYAIRFRLYAQPTGGTHFWEENQQVRTSGGLFSTLLGSATSIGSVPDAGAAYLGMAVEGGAELAPRLRIASAAYSYLSARAANSDMLQGRDTATFSRSTHSHDATYVNEGQASSVTSAMITDATVAAADLGQMGASSGQVMKWTGAAWQPRNDSVGGGGGAADSAWVRQGSDSVLFTVRLLGLAKGGSGSTLYGNNRQTHVNFGTECTTGTSGLNQASCVVSGGRRNAATGDAAGVASGYANKARGINAFVGGGFSNIAQADQATVAGGTANAVYGPYGGVGSGASNVAGDAAGDTAAVVAGGRDNAVTGMFSFVGAGRDNTADGSFVTVAGGQGNSTLLANHAVIGGGYQNDIQAGSSTIAGGYSNSIGSAFASIGGGLRNGVGGTSGTIAGGDSNYVAGDRGAIGGGRRNSTDYSYCGTIGGGHADTVRAPYGAVGGGYSNLASKYNTDTASVIAGGWDNEVSGRYSTIGGGACNDVDDYYATIAGGCSTRAWGRYSTVGGGLYNWTDGRFGTIAGGDSNRNIDCDYGAIGGGYRNSVEDADYGTVSGGRLNDVSAGYGTVGGGQYNLVDEQYGTIAGGDSNHAVSTHSVIGGGGLNWVDRSAGYGTVVGGRADSVRALYGAAGGGYSNLVGDAADDTAVVVAGGWNNVATGKFNSVGGGYQNNASNYYSTIGGGRGNTVNGPQATVGGGWNNLGSGWHSVVAGGMNNTASGTSATVSGGQDHTASGYWSSVAGGRYDTCAADYSLLSGYNVRARASADYTLAFGEDCSTSTARAVVFYHSGAATRMGVGVQNPTHYIDVTGGSYCDASGWHNPSSRELKQDIARLTPEECRAILQQLLATDVARYKYKADEHGQEHIGLIAEEAPGVLTGPEHKAIGTGDAIGCLMAAVKAQQAEIEQLRTELTKLGR